MVITELTPTMAVKSSGIKLPSAVPVISTRAPPEIRTKLPEMPSVVVLAAIIVPETTRPLAWMSLLMWNGMSATTLAATLKLLVAIESVCMTVVPELASIWQPFVVVAKRIGLAR